MSLLHRRSTMKTSNTSKSTSTRTSTLRDIREAPAASTPSKALQQVRQFATFVVSILAVRWFWYEWRPWHVFSWWREVTVWVITWRLYAYLMKRQTRRPLLNYGRWALLLLLNDDDHAADSKEAWAKALAARGLRVAVVVVDNTNNDDKIHPPTKHVHEAITPVTVDHWLGQKQLEGGVGVFVTGSVQGRGGGSLDTTTTTTTSRSSSGSSSTADLFQSVVRHMTFRHSGAILRVVGSSTNQTIVDYAGTDTTEQSITSDDDSEEEFVYSKNGIVVLDIPAKHLSSPFVVDAALEKVGETRRLTLRHVLWQRIKQAWRMRIRW